MKKYVSIELSEEDVTILFSLKKSVKNEEKELVSRIAEKAQDTFKSKSSINDRTKRIAGFLNSLDDEDKALVTLLSGVVNKLFREHGSSVKEVTDKVDEFDNDFLELVKRSMSLIMNELLISALKRGDNNEVENLIKLMLHGKDDSKTISEIDE